MSLGAKQLNVAVAMLHGRSKYPVSQSMMTRPDHERGKRHRGEVCVHILSCLYQTLTMEGEGSLKNWLKQTGREVARAAGSELKSVAKDRAAAYARELIGEGLKVVSMNAK